LVEATGLYALNSLGFRGRTRREPVVDIDGQTNADELELNISPTSASLSGTIVGGAASSYVMALVMEDVAAEPVDDSVTQLKRPDNTGRYLFASCRPGSYVLFALRDPDPAVLDRSNILKAVRKDTAAGIRVTLAAGAETRLDVRVRQPD
jgi:hypothetical protein